MGLLNAVLIALSRRNGFENSELGAVAGLLVAIPAYLT